LIWRRIKTWFPWQIVRIFGGLSYFNISYGVLLFVPIMHELYTRADPIMEWFGAPAEFPITLQWLYAASLVYAVAILLYQIFCPTEIKRFSRPEEYVRSQYEIFQRADPQNRIAIVLARLHPQDDAAQRSRIETLYRSSVTAETASERSNAKAELNAILSDLHGHAVQAYLLDQYDKSNLRYPFARWLCLACYGAGCVILATLLIVRSVSVFTDFREANVLIKTEMADSILRLLAYTSQESEFQILESVLKRANVNTDYSPIDSDRSGREGRRYYVPQSAVASFGDAVGGTFALTGAFTPGPATPSSQYACKEKKLGGRDGKGCQDFSAPDDPAAFVACSLIAGRRGWYFGLHQPGKCTTTSRSWLPW
jgi:hypothetical protein